MVGGTAQVFRLSNGFDEDNNTPFEDCYTGVFEQFGKFPFIIRDVACL
jgi:hypothetical protein